MNKENHPKTRGDTIVYPYCFINTVSKRIGDVEIKTIWHFRHPLQVQIPVNSVPFSVQSGTGMSDDCVSKFFL